MNPLAFIFLGAVTYVAHSVLIKFASGKIDPYLGMLCYALGTVIIAIPALIGWKFYGTSEFSMRGIASFLAAGSLLVVGTSAIFLAFDRGVPFSIGTPVVNISVVMGGIIFGYFLFGENISLMRLLGVCFGIVSIILLTRS